MSVLTDSGHACVGVLELSAVAGWWGGARGGHHHGEEKGPSILYTRTTCIEPGQVWITTPGIHSAGVFRVEAYHKVYGLDAKQAGLQRL